MSDFIPVPHSFDEAAWRDEVLRARAQTLAAFRDPRTSPYAAVARHDFSGGTPLVFGSAGDCDVQLAGLPAHAMRARVEGESFVCQSIELDTNFLFFEKGAAQGAERIEARFGPGARVQLGRYGLRFSHQNFPAVLVLDPQSPRLTDPSEAHPPLWFEPDPAHRLEAKLERDPSPREEIVLSTRGQKRRGLKLGTLLFSLGGETHRLTALRLLEPGSDEAGFSIFFRDATSGNETYPVGRYVDPRPLDGPGGDRWLLDFNRAYNPACAFSPLFNCPIPPRENRLPIAVRAGERDPHPHS